MLSNRINRLAPPPRSVPLTAICSAMFGVSGAFGAIFMIAGLLFTIVFTQGYRPIDDFRIAVSQTTAWGVVTNLSQTNSTENEVWVYEYEFVFTTESGREVSGRSYSTGERWSVGERVKIEYVPEDPGIARIKGARSSLFMAWVLFVLIFPAIGAGLFVWAAISGLRQVRLLRNGEVADARILSQRPTNVQVNGTPVMEFSYEIRTSMGETFNGSAKALPSKRIGDEESEPALYLPSKPSRSTLVDAISLSHPLDVDELSGQWISHEGKIKAAIYILIWVLTIALAGYEVLSTFGILG